MARALSASEVASLGLDADEPAKNPKAGRAISDDEADALGLNKPQQFGPLRDNPTFSTAPPERDLPAVPPSPPMPGPSAPTTTQGQAAATHAVSGAMLGFDDEAFGLLKAAGAYGAGDESGAVTIPQPGQGPGPAAIYREGRQERRDLKDQTRKDWPKTALAAEIGGGLATIPLTGGGGAAKGLAGAGKAVLRAGATGAAAGAGNSTADVTKGEFAPLLRDTLVGGAFGAGVGAGGQVLGAGVRGVGKLLTGDLKRRVVNEVAEGTANVGQTERKRLVQAGDAILREVTTGPDAKAVRGAYGAARASNGRETLRPIIDKLDASNDRKYAAFERAGRSHVNLPAYQKSLQTAVDEAVAAGDSRLADGLEAFMDKISEQALKAKGMTLRQLRGLTTEAQTTAANKLGSLLERQNAKDARRVQAVVTKAMDDTLTRMSEGSRNLQRAAKAIRSNNERMHPLLVVYDALETRARKEESAPGLLVRGAKALTGPGVGSLLGAASASSDEDKTLRMLGGAAAGAGILPAARVAERGLTTMGIKAAQSPRGVSAAARLAEVLGRQGAREAVSPDRERE